MNERVVASGPLSPVTTYRIIVEGPFGAREADRIIQVARLLRSFVSEDTPGAGEIEVASWLPMPADGVRTSDTMGDAGG